MSLWQIRAHSSQQRVARGVVNLVRNHWTQWLIHWFYNLEIQHLKVHSQKVIARVFWDEPKQINHTLCHWKWWSNGKNVGQRFRAKWIFSYILEKCFLIQMCCKGLFPFFLLPSLATYLSLFKPLDSSEVYCGSLEIGIVRHCLPSAT